MFIIDPTHDSTNQPKIILQYDLVTQTGFNLIEVQNENRPYVVETDTKYYLSLVRDSINYFQEAVNKMCNVQLEVQNSSDIRSSEGIVFTTLDGLPTSFPNYSAISSSLSSNGLDNYNHLEAFNILTNSNRILIIANNPCGFVNAVVELLESVDYVVLGMGPNWIHVPNYRTHPLIFNINVSGRPGFFRRKFSVTSGQERGVGTIYHLPRHDGLSEPDEMVYESHKRWMIGSRMRGISMPHFPGHSFKTDSTAESMIANNVTDGFLAEIITIDIKANKHEYPTVLMQLFLASDTNEAFKSKTESSSPTGFVWENRTLNKIGFGLDVSVPFVRELYLNNIVKQFIINYFNNQVQEVVIIPTDPQDGGLNRYTQFTAYPNWYPDYLTSEGHTFGISYPLHGFKSINQPNEIWDKNAPSDQIYAFNNWLLMECDQWIDEDEQWETLTPPEKNKLKGQLRCSFQSYAYHDVPPNFNIDKRIRISIAGYAKNRGRGKWKNIQSHVDIAQAFNLLNPKVTVSDYWIFSYALGELESNSIRPRNNFDTEHILDSIQSLYRVKIKALNAESDYNFGRMGIGYYLYTKVLWNPNMTKIELDEIKDRWLQFAFGNGWHEMKDYYEHMLQDNYTYNGIGNWAKAIQLIKEADNRIDATIEPAAQKRLDDLKHYWYFYYLLETGQGDRTSTKMQDFVWKGQMSYMIAMHSITRKIFGYIGTTIQHKWISKLIQDYPRMNSIINSNAHYSYDEINGVDGWWTEMLNNWKLPVLNHFKDFILSDGVLAKDIDLNDLVAVRELIEFPFSPLRIGSSIGIYYHNNHNHFHTLFQYAKNTNDELGFQVFFRVKDDSIPKNWLNWGVLFWNNRTSLWEELIDYNLSQSPIDFISSIAPSWVPEGYKVKGTKIRFIAPKPGTYKFKFNNADNGSLLTSLNFDLRNWQFNDFNTSGLTFNGKLFAEPAQSAWIYIPQGVKSLDIDVWVEFLKPHIYEYTFQFFKNFKTNNLSQKREVKLSNKGIHKIPIEPGEDGSICQIIYIRLSVPYCFSIPNYYSKTPNQLLIPKAIAKADGLTILENELPSGCLGGIINFLRI